MTVSSQVLVLKFPCFLRLVPLRRNYLVEMIYEHLQSFETPLFDLYWYWRMTDDYEAKQ